jgi:hypothetical protein
MLNPNAFFHPSNISLGTWPLVLLAFCGLLVWLFPNTQQITDQWRPVLQNSVQSGQAIVRVRWMPNMTASLVTALLLAACIMSLSNVSDFIYFKF